MQQMEQSVQRCLQQASRPGFPRYNRSKATVAACKEARDNIDTVTKLASQNKNLACSAQAPLLHFDIWMVEFIGTSRMQSRVEEGLDTLATHCYHGDRSR